MNDLNEKLWSDAVELYIDSAPNDDINLTDPYVVREIRKKFAELIVRECAAYVEGTGTWLVAMEMKEHFGVEE